MTKAAKKLLTTEENIINDGHLGFITPNSSSNALKLLQSEIDERELLVAEIKSTIDQIQDKIKIAPIDLETNLTLSLKEESSAPTSFKVKDQKIKRFQNSRYYLVKNHFELHRTGQGFVKDYDAGLKSFAFNSLDRGGMQQDAILAIASFFNYHREIGVTILVEHSHLEWYFKRIPDLKKVSITVAGLDKEIQAYKADGIELIDLGWLKTELSVTANQSFETMIQMIKCHSELLFWDVANITPDSDQFLLLGITKEVDKISLLIAHKSCRFTDVKRLVQYYQKYQICLKGLIVSEQCS